jgi:hypothetical protein
VSDGWDAKAYRQHAAAWAQKPASLPEDHPERKFCYSIADAYAKLARLIAERRRSLRDGEDGDG